MRTIDKFFVVIGVVGLAGAVVAGFADQRKASFVMLTLLIVGWLAWLTVEVVMLRKRATTSLGQSLSTPRRTYLPNALLISATKRNPLKISAEFLLWPECTIMLWVLVPPFTQGLRDSPNNRYLLAHHTGTGAEREQETYKNQFVLRHSSTHHRWEFLTSNRSAEYGNRLAASDGLEPGWHHFLIAWDRERPKSVLLIDGGAGGSDVSNSSFVHWPEEADRIFVGTWLSEWSGHFCETKLYQLRIFDRYLVANDPEVQEVLRTKPRV